MGLEQAVKLPGEPPAWASMRALFERQKYPVQVRMIDGELALPDEEPPAAWRELRLGTPAGMVTVRREPGRIALVIWGNADAKLVAARNALAWAFASAAGGTIVTDQGERGAQAFLEAGELPEEFRQ
jgi:hypothetical protein